MNLNSKPKIKRVYGRKTGRPLNPARQAALDTLLPVLEIPVNKLTEKADLPPRSLFDHDLKELWFEIGFGSGEHLTALMERHPDYGFIGAEPFVNGMSCFLKDIKNKPHNNIRVLMDDAMMIANSLSDNSLNGIYVLNPDPWHKARHHKRRIITPKNLDQFARILKTGGKLIMSTDVEDLAEWMLEAAIEHPAFIQTPKSAKDCRTPPKDWIKTRYEQKGARNSGRMAYMIFEKK